jgi:UDP-2,3-diacylglucosamine hydrolase
MKITAISDVHIKTRHDDADQLLVRFLQHPDTQSADLVFLLGDIFDLMCGPHNAYLEEFEHIFKLLTGLMEAGKKVYYFEGNHDVHLDILFQRFWSDQRLTPFQEPLILDLAGKTYYFSHGDEHDVHNLSYQRYKRLILSPPLRFVANHLMPHKLLHYLGERASRQSRKRGHRNFNQELVRERFRTGVKLVTAGKYDLVIGGHSHVQDICQIEGTRTTFVNNGYALKSKTFILIQDHVPSFVALM